MANCRGCGIELALLNRGRVGFCKKCGAAGMDNKKIEAIMLTTETEPNAPKIGAATLAYSSAFIIAICSVISFFVLLEDNNGFLGFMVLVSGLGGAIFFMIMAEISHNVASLVRLANAKKEKE